MLEAWLVLALAVALLVAEAHLPGGVLGALGVAGLIASGLLFREEGVDIPIAVIVAAAILVGGFVIFAAQRVIATYRKEPVRTGWEELIGHEAVVREPLDPAGQVFVEGALWKARVGHGEPAVEPGVRVLIDSVDGLTLVVRPLPASEPADRSPA